MTADITVLMLFFILFLFKTILEVLGRFADQLDSKIILFNDLFNFTGVSITDKVERERYATGEGLVVCFTVCLKPNIDQKIAHKKHLDFLNLHHMEITY